MWLVKKIKIEFASLFFRGFRSFAVCISLTLDLTNTSVELDNIVQNRTVCVALNMYLINC